MREFLKNNLEKGFVAVLSTVLILVGLLTVGLGMTALLFYQSQISGNVVKASQAYVAAESGVEDALLRIKKGIDLSETFVFELADAQVSADVSSVVGGSRTINASGNNQDRIKKIQVVQSITADTVSFYYGAQVGDGGMEMGNNARVAGNVFSNASVIAPTGVGYVDGTVKVATIGSKIEGLEIQDDAYTHNCKNSFINGILYFSGGANESCVASQGIQEHPTQEKQPLPIDQTLIDKWKNDALEGGIIGVDYVVAGGDTIYLGPKKIEGHLTVGNNATLILRGALWVAGDITINNGAAVKLDPNYYYGLSGVLIADGRIIVNPGVALNGSGTEGSYLLLLSTSASLNKIEPAVRIDNTTDGGVFYAGQGLIVVSNNVSAREVTGYQVFLENNAVISYESGLVDAGFSSGPGGGWQITSWQEVD